MQVGSGRERRGEAVCQGELERGALGLGGAREKGVEGMAGSPDPSFLRQNICSPGGNRDLCAPDQHPLCLRVGAAHTLHSNQRESRFSRILSCHTDLRF